MKKILTLKHWHLFLLIVVCGTVSSPGLAKEIFRGIAGITFSAWVYAIGFYGYQQTLALGLQPMNIKLFRINSLILCIPCFILSDWNSGSDSFSPVDIPLIIFFLYILFALFQTIIFTCKILARIEEKREVTFADYITNFLLFGMLPIGIWILQPKVTRLLSQREAAL